MYSRMTAIMKVMNSTKKRLTGISDGQPLTAIEDGTINLLNQNCGPSDHAYSGNQDTDEPEKADGLDPACHQHSPSMSQ